MNYKRNIRIAMLLVIIVGGGMWGASTTNKYKNEKDLIVGKWISQETGKLITFTPKGTVEVEEEKTGDYTIISQDLMEYSVGGQLFRMTYQVDGRSLLWGVVGEEEEKFDRKGF